MNYTMSDGSIGYADTVDNRRNNELADAVIHKINNLGKIEALIGSTILGLVGILGLKFQLGEALDPLILQVLMILITLLIAIQLLYYLKFMIEKREWRQDQLALAEVQNKRIELELKKLSLQVELSKMEMST